MNNRIYRVVDVIKHFQEQKEHHPNITSVLHEKMIGIFFAMYFKYLELNIIVDEIIETSHEIYKK